MAGCCLSATSRCTRPSGSVGHPVDVGWAWVMVAAAGGIFGFQGAAFKLFGMVYVEMLDHFRSDPKVTLYVFSVSGMVTLLAGPLVSMFVQKTSQRFVVATGSLCMAAGIIGTGFAPSMEVTFFTWGMLYGFGVTCLLICGLTCTGPYFSKYRGLAVGISASGNGVLAFILPNVLRALFDHYSFSSALLLFGGVALQVLILAMLVRSPSYYSERRQSSLQTCFGFDVAARFACCTLRSRRPPPAAGGHADGSGDAHAIEAAARENGMAPEVAELKAAMAGSDGIVEEEEGPERLEANRTGTSGHPAASANMAAANVAGDGRAATDSEKAPTNGSNKAPASSATAAATTGLQQRPQPQSASYAELLRNPRMWLIGLTMLFVANAVSIVFSAIPPYADSIGISRQSVSLLLSVTGAFEIFCRGFHGWFSDRNVMPCLLQLALCSGLTGLAAILCPIVGGEAGIGLLTAACGATGTSCFSLVPIVIRQLLGADKVTTGMGLQLFFQSSSFMLSTFMAGYLHSLGRSWVPVFYYIGANMLIAFLLAGSYGVVLAVRQRQSVSLAKRSV